MASEGALAYNDQLGPGAKSLVGGKGQRSLQYLV